MGDRAIGADIIKTLEKYGGVNRNKYEGKGGLMYYIDPKTNTIWATPIHSTTYNVVAATFKQITAEEHKIAVSISDIAKHFGVEPNRIVIEV